MKRRWLGRLAGLALLVAATPARAEQPRRIVAGSDDEGAWGRLEGDVDLAVRAGASSDFESATSAFGVGAHWFSTAGIVAGYEDALGGHATAWRRSLGIGVDLRPAFLPRFSNDLERGPAWLDLMLDSTSLALGAFFAQPRGQRLGDVRGFEASLGLGAPLAGSASGLWLEMRGRLRWPAGDAGDRAAPHGAVVATLAWHAAWLSPMAR